MPPLSACDHMSLSKLKWINWNLCFPFLYTFAFWYLSSLIITLSFKTYLTFWGGSSGFYFPSVTTAMLCWNGVAQKVRDNRGLLQHLHTTHTHDTHHIHTPYILTQNRSLWVSHHLPLLRCSPPAILLKSAFLLTPKSFLQSLNIFLALKFHRNQTFILFVT